MLTTPKVEKSDEQLEHTISKYFPQAEFISIIDLLHFVQQNTSFLDCFKHHLLQNIRIKNLIKIFYMLLLLGMVVASLYQKCLKYQKVLVFKFVRFL